MVTRGSIFTVEKTRPDFHEPTGFNIDVCRAVRTAVHGSHPDVPVILQGSIVEVGQAEWALGGYDDEALCDAVEMTRAQIADPDLVAKVAADETDRVRPCTRCNQTCQVRDARNPIVTCIGEPTSGRETEDPDWYVPSPHPRDVVVLGAGPAGLEAARVATLRGHHVTVDRTVRLRSAGSLRSPDRTARWSTGGATSTNTSVPTYASRAPPGRLATTPRSSRPPDRFPVHVPTR